MYIESSRRKAHVQNPRAHIISSAFSQALHQIRVVVWKYHLKTRGEEEDKATVTLVEIERSGKEVEVER